MAGNKPRPARRNNRARNGNGRARADRQLAQGTGRAVRRPFLVAPKAHTCRGWDAFDPYHLALPRATGPYAVVRTSSLISTSAKYCQFGVFRNSGAGDLWNNTVLITDVVSGDPVNGNNNTRRHVVPVPGGIISGSSMTVVPAAVSVQLMNPEALQTTTGIIAGAVCHTQFDINDRIETYDDLCTAVISYFRPRLMSAAKVALRGVQANAYPLNMSAVSDFKPLAPAVEGTFTMNNTMHPEGWAPIIFINQGGVALNFLVSVEWRVRFDVGNPAVASHTHHGVTPDGVWEQAINRAVSMGNGILDIADKVASVGQAVAPLIQKMPKALP